GAFEEGERVEARLSRDRGFGAVNAPRAGSILGLGLGSLAPRQVDLGGDAGRLPPWHPAPQPAVAPGLGLPENNNDGLKTVDAGATAREVPASGR
ncbi:MAG: hypothetical protein BJ554DRAFT_873, partial [Olpidium bornovanus]